MSARTATSAKRKWKWRAHREVTVEDQRTERTARAAASECIWGEKEGEFRVRELTATIYAEHDDDASSGTFVKFEASEVATGRATSHRHFFIGDTSPQGVQLGDLPLLVLALQEAIRIGVKQGAFPEIRGDQRSRSRKLAIVQADAATVGQIGGDRNPPA